MSPPPGDDGADTKASAEAAIAQVEQIRLLVLGMEERLRVREEKLVKTMEKAGQESHKFEVLQKDALSTKA